MKDIDGLGHPTRGYKRARALLAAASAMVAASGLSLRPADAQDSAAPSAQQPVTSYAFGPAFAAPKGKKIVLITCGSLGIGCVFGAKGAQEAAAALGWTSKIVDGKFDPSTWNTAVQQAVAGGADGIIMLAVNPALIQGGLDRARAAKIPVVDVFQPRFAGAPAIDGDVTSDHAAAGVTVADWIASDSGGKAHVLVLDVSEFPEVMKRNDALATELARVCPNCKVERQRFGAALAAQRLAPLVTAQLREHPDISYVTGPYDATGTFITQGVRQAQATGKVKYVNFEGNPIGFELMKGGEQAAEMAVASPFAGWLAVDVLARKLAGQPVPDDVAIPQRLFVAGSTLPAGDRGWDADFDYKAALDKVWLK